MDVATSRVASEVLHLSLLMRGLTMSVLVNERYDGAQDHNERDIWGPLRHLWAESGTSSLGEAKGVASLKRDLLHLPQDFKS